MDSIKSLLSIKPRNKPYLKVIMKLCFMITGLLRGFSNGLLLFLKELSRYIDIDLYIYTTKDNYDYKFQTTQGHESFTTIVSEQFCKLFVIDCSAIDKVDNLSAREKNIYHQWKKIYLCFQNIPPQSYDYIIRIRPDINVQIKPLEFLEIVAKLNSNTIYIPFGNDLSSINNKGSDKGLNDQVAIGSYDQMKIYSEFYNYLTKKKELERPLVSEVLLLKYLSTVNASIERFSFTYSLHLSEPSVLAICGNSGVGKSTVLRAIEKIFPYDSSLVLETDRYHKWERSSTNWKEYTHLNPNANNLEKLADDTYLLKMGETVQSVDYDHTTGKFTSALQIEPKNYIFLCGLHTLYKEKMRGYLDFKIYIDTEETLNKYWKVRRDTAKRGHTIDHILKTIESRKADFDLYILPQKLYADCILRIYYEEEVPDYNVEIDIMKLQYSITIRNEYVPLVSKLLTTFSKKQTILEGSIEYILYNNIQSHQIIDFVKNQNIFIGNADTAEDGYLGIMQILVLLVLFK